MDGKFRKPHVCECGSHAWLSLTKSGVALIDPEDIPAVQGWSWALTGKGYAFRNNKTEPGPKQILMHRVIASAPGGDEVDHENMWRTDNRSVNLRVCLASQNQWNTGAKSTNRSGHKGVSWDAQRRKWRAKLVVMKKYIHVGHFDDLDEAVNAYEEVAARSHGEFFKPGRPAAA